MSIQGSVWPNFFIVGAGKCGTTTLYQHLSKHPKVFFPELKEPDHFAACPAPGEMPSDIVHVGNQAEYLRLYRKARGFVAIGDASTPYLYDEGAAKRIHDVCPKARIVIILRDPVERAFSEYLMNRERGFEAEKSFLNALRQDHARTTRNWWTPQGYIGRGMYYDQVRRYFEIFGRDQVLVLLTEDLKRNPQFVFSSLCDHIGVDPKLLEGVELSREHNVWKSPRSSFARIIMHSRFVVKWRHLVPATARKRLLSLLFETEKPQMDEESNLFLQKLFEPDIILLERLLGRPLPELRESWVCPAELVRP